MKIIKLTLLSALAIAALVPHQTKAVRYQNIVLVGSTLTVGYLLGYTIISNIFEAIEDNEDNNNNNNVPVQQGTPTISPATTVETPKM